MTSNQQLSTLTHFDILSHFGYDKNIHQNMPEKLYSLKEVADMLRVSERSIFRYIHSGKLKATKIGYWRISEKDVQQFLNDNSNLNLKAKKPTRKNAK